MKACHGNRPNPKTKCNLYFNEITFYIKNINKLKQDEMLRGSTILCNYMLPMIFAHQIFLFIFGCGRITKITKGFQFMQL